MKKLLSLVLAFCMLFAAAECAFAAGGDTVIDKTWCVLIPDEATEQENYSANIIAEKLSKVFGSEIPVKKEAAEKFIAINAADGADVSSVADNGYRITAADDAVYINGTGVRGIVHGGFRFLEEFCGIKVYTESLEVIPEAETVTVYAGTDIVYEPYFEYTDTDWISPTDPYFSVANGLTGGVYRHLSKAQGGTVNYLGGFCHTFTGQFCSKDKYFETHPEYFALRDGERKPTQLCLTNPDVVRTVTDETLAMLAAGHDPDASVQIVSLTQADNYNYCQCENCRDFENAHGGVQSATMINFVNQVADAVKAAGYDNVAIDTFAYQYTRKAPTGIKPRDNMIIRLCTIECCFAHALDDAGCENNIDLMNDLENWSEICDRIYVWDYTTNYANTCCVFPDFDVIQANAKVFYEHNVKGIYEEGAYYAKSCDTEFSDLRSYMIAKSLQDPYCDIDEEMKGFIAAYYGDTEGYIYEAIKMFSKFAGDESGHLSIYQGAKDSLTLNDFQIAKIDKLFEAAKSENITEEQLANIKRSELSWRFWKSVAKRGEFSLWNQNRFSEKQQLFDDIVACGTMMMCEGQEYGDLTDCASVRYAIPTEWSMYEKEDSGTAPFNFFGTLLDEILPVLTAFNIFYAFWRTFTRQYCDVFANVC